MNLIKKYGNRRLYDTAASRYITLEELAGQIRDGGDVRVVDAKTNEDLTQSTLAQIILESRGASKLLPVPLLVQLIRLGNDALADFFGRYVTAALEMYLQSRPLNPFAQMGMGFGFPRMPWSTEPAPPPPADDVATLRRELDELKKAMGKKRR